MYVLTMTGGCAKSVFFGMDIPHQSPPQGKPLHLLSSSAMHCILEDVLKILFEHFATIFEVFLKNFI